MSLQLKDKAGLSEDNMPKKPAAHAQNKAIKCRYEIDASKSPVISRGSASTRLARLVR
jgi:hypothetical protein